MPSSRTPEGEPNFCLICRQAVRIEPSTTPARDAPCPNCGSLLWFRDPDYTVAFVRSFDLDTCMDKLDEWIRTTAKPRLVLDFEGVEQVTSLMLGRLISLHRKIGARGGSLKVRNLESDVLDAFRLTKLDRFGFDSE